MINWDTAEALRRLGAIRDRGDKVFTGAFNISNSGSTKPKINRVCEDYVEPVWQARDRLLAAVQGSTLDAACRVLKGMPGLGGSGFMAAQVVCDLKYTSLLAKASGWWTWCSRGPGSVRGLNILQGRDVDAPPPKDFVKQVNDLRAVVAKRLPALPPLHAQDIQNGLCELSKYERALAGGGSKRTYAGV